MANTFPRNTAVTRMDDTANLRANQSTPPSTIPSGRGGSGSAPRGLTLGDCRQDPTSIPSGRGASGSPVGGTSIPTTKPVQIPAGRGPAGTSSGGLSPSDANQPRSRIPGK